MKFRPTKISFNEALLRNAPAQGVDRIMSDVRTRLIEEENKMFMEACVNYNVDPDALLKTARLNAELQAELRRATDALPLWISVNERYPEHGATVLTINSEGTMDVYDYDENWPTWFVKWGGLVKIGDVTHWMYLPEPPKETEKENG